jgi:hypothetical protein
VRATAGGLDFLRGDLLAGLVDMGGGFSFSIDGRYAAVDAAVVAAK